MPPILYTHLERMTSVKNHFVKRILFLLGLRMLRQRGWTRGRRGLLRFPDLGTLFLLRILASSPHHPKKFLGTSKCSRNWLLEKKKDCLFHHMTVSLYNIIISGLCFPLQSVFTSSKEQHIDDANDNKAPA
jgi:hypothetical protein